MGFTKHNFMSWEMGEKFSLFVGALCFFMKNYPALINGALQFSVFKIKNLGGILGGHPMLKWEIA
jgi:hypothetical protein